MAVEKKNDRSGELTKKDDGNINSAAKNGKVERGMLLMLKDQQIQTDKKAL